jgi:hypothetical protein
MNNIVLIDKDSKHVIGVKSDGEAIMFSCNQGSGTLLTNELVTDDGRTVGERNRLLLLTMLNEWLDATMKAKHETIN